MILQWYIMHCQMLKIAHRHEGQCVTGCETREQYATTLYGTCNTQQGPCNAEVTDQSKSEKPMSSSSSSSSCSTQIVDYQHQLCDGEACQQAGSSAELWP